MYRQREYKQRRYKLDALASEIEVAQYKHEQQRKHGYHVMSREEFKKRLVEDLGINAEDRYEEEGVCAGEARTV